MIIEPTRLDGAFLLELDRRVDDRGWFARAFCAREMEARGMNARVAQVNVSSNAKRGTVRGLHFQRAPHGESKVVRVIRGAVHDVIVDLRVGSPTYCQWIGIELSADNHRSLYVPLGFAHGFQTLTDDAELLYLMGDFYAPGSASGVRWDDPAFGVVWPEPISTITPGDLAFPPFSR